MLNLIINIKHPTVNYFFKRYFFKRAPIYRYGQARHPEFLFKVVLQVLVTMDVQLIFMAVGMNMDKVVIFKKLSVF